MVVGVILGLVSYTVMAERRISAAIQDRIGPNRVGMPLGGVNILGLFTMPKWTWWGLGQPLADALKFMLKEEFTPNSVNTNIELEQVLSPRIRVRTNYLQSFSSFSRSQGAQ